MGKLLVLQHEGISLGLRNLSFPGDLPSLVATKPEWQQNFPLLGA